MRNTLTEVGNASGAAGKTAAVPSLLAEVYGCATLRICKLPTSISFWIHFSDLSIACQKAALY